MGVAYSRIGRVGQLMFLVMVGSKLHFGPDHLPVPSFHLAPFYLPFPHFTVNVQVLITFSTRLFLFSLAIPSDGVPAS